jgi:type IV pilus assembly protein PilC
MKTSRNFRMSALTVRQLATLVGAGLPLERSLNVLAVQHADMRQRQVLQQAAALLHGGHHFSEALAALPRAFDPLFVNLVRAGESGGVLPLLLERLADYQERRERLRSRLLTALIYPAAILGLAALVVLFLLIWIVPQFEGLLGQALQERPIPVATQWILTLSQMLREHVAGLLMAVFILLIIGWQLLRQPAFQNRFALWLERWPLVGTIAQKAALAQFSRTLGTLLTSAVPLVTALEVTQRTVFHQRLSAAVANIQRQVQQGGSLAGLLEAQAVFPPMVVSLVQVGEETGQLGPMLLKAAELYEQQVDVAVSRLTGLIEPVLIVALGLLVAGVVAALFMPLVQVMQELNTGG